MVATDLGTIPTCTTALDDRAPTHDTRNAAMMSEEEGSSGGETDTFSSQASGSDRSSPRNDRAGRGGHGSTEP